MSPTASQVKAERELIDVEKWCREEDIKREAAAEAGPSKSASSSRSNVPKKRTLIVLSDEESDDDFEIVTAPRIPLASSSKINKTASSSSIDRGNPDWIVKRDQKELRKSGSQGPRKREPFDATNVVQHAPAIQSDEPVLSPQQASILARILEGESFFFTGSAGTGKSVLFRAIVQGFKKKSEALAGGQRSGVIPWELAITASTGMAAINVGGSTLHSWAGVGLALEPKQVLAAKISRSAPARQRWEQASALIVDEISMIDGTFFDKLDHIGRTIRQDRRPFGGLQLILCGDFHQLPPVAKYGEPPAVYAFESPAWKEVFSRDNTACLKQVFRQKDVEFVRLLDEMRKGRVSREDEKKMQSLSRPLYYNDGVPAVELYPLKEQVEKINRQKLGALKTETRTYVCNDVPGIIPGGSRTPRADMIKALDQSKLVPELVLKVGAVVMLLANYTDMGLCNGSIGTVVDMMTVADATAANIPVLTESSSSYHIFPVIEFIPGKYVTVPTPKRVCVPCFEIDVKNPDGSVKAKRVQIPLILAWAMTVHKAQGSSLERVKVDMNKIFADGQAYVAMSRATSMEGLQVLGFQEHCVKVNYKVLDWSASVEGDI